MPASSNTTLYDIGRSFGLWVSAFEILAHPGRGGGSNIDKVYCLFEQAVYSSHKTAAQKFKAIKSKTRRSLPCSAYGKMYQLRNDFMHGNPIIASRIKPRKDRPALFWIAPALYRLALTGFLKISPSRKEPADFADFVKSQTQREIEQAVLQYR
jgi:hypothetical protein